MRMLFVGGGTGGPTAPLIAVAESLRERFPKAEFVFLGTRRALDDKFIAQAAFPIVYRTIPAGKWRRQLRTGPGRVCGIFTGYPCGNSPTRFSSSAFHPARRADSNRDYGFFFAHGAGDRHRQRTFGKVPEEQGACHGQSRPRRDSGRKRN